ncbi:MAG: sugar phosphate nucleotidyltransferase [Candidatus Neomarinimicrobiota bacterium]
MNQNLIILAAGISSRMKKSETVADLDQALVQEANIKPKAMLSLGSAGRPFMDYLLFNAAGAGYKNVVIVINERDNFTESYYKDQDSGALEISFAVQSIPNGRSKPLGTADALLQGLYAKKEWRGKKFTVCNSDNLYSVEVFKKLLQDNHLCALIDYDRDGLGVEPERVKAFSVIHKDKQGFLLEIVEKPNLSQVENARSQEGRVGVSMNIFSLDYNSILPALVNCPLHPIRREKELPTAIKIMIENNPRAMFTIPVNETVPDLTGKADILKVQAFLERLTIKN